MSTVKPHTTELRDNDLDASSSENDEYAVKDVYLAAYLLALGYKIQFLRSTDAFTSEFYFKGVPSGVIIGYYNNSPFKTLTANKLFSAFQEARKMSRGIRSLPQQKSNEFDDDN